MKRPYKILLFLLSLLFYCFSLHPHLAVAQKSNWKIFQEQGVPFTFRYPTDIFTPYKRTAGVWLESKYFLLYGHTTSGRGYTKKYVYSIDFTLHDAPLLETMQKEASSYAFTNMFPEKTLESFRPQQGFSSTFSQAGRSGYLYQEGSHGINTNHYFLPKEPAQTLVITLRYFSPDSPHTSGKIFPEQAQLKLFQTILKTLTFLDH